MAQKKVEVGFGKCYQLSNMQIKNIQPTSQVPPQTNGQTLKTVAGKSLLLPNSIKNSAKCSLDVGRSTFSQKLKNLLEKNEQDIVRNTPDDPYAFSDVDLSEGMLLHSNSLPSHHDILSGKVPKLLSRLNGLPKPEQNIPSIHKHSLKNVQSNNSSFTVVQSSAQKRTNSQEERKATNPSQIASNQLNYVVKCTGKDKPANFGKSQMSKLAIAKIEKSIVNRKKVVLSNAHVGLKNISKLPPKSLTTTIEPTLPPHRPITSDLRDPLSKAVAIEEKPLISGGNVDKDRKCSLMDTGLAYANSSVSTSKVGSLEQMWQLRNRFRHVRRTHSSFGINTIRGTDESGEGMFTYQNHWFSLCEDYNLFTGNHRKRDARLAQLKTELRHKLIQYRWKHRDDYRKDMSRLLINCAKTQPNFAALVLQTEQPTKTAKHTIWPPNSGVEVSCKYGESGAECIERALPGVPACTQHIPQHTSQVLFSRCFTNGCQTPAIGKHIAARCIQHQTLTAQIQDAQVSSTAPRMVSTVRRHRSSNASCRSSKSKKRKRQQQSRDVEYSMKEVGYVAPPNDSPPPPNTVPPDNVATARENVELVEELAMNTGDLPLDSAVLATLDHHTLDETDLTHVLNHISSDAFNDLFAGSDKCVTETEELERALEAVNKDVESLKLLNLLQDESFAENLAADWVRFSHGPPVGGEAHGLPPIVISPHADVLQS